MPVRNRSRQFSQRGPRHPNTTGIVAIVAVLVLVVACGTAQKSGTAGGRSAPAVLSSAASTPTTTTYPSTSPATSAAQRDSATPSTSRVSSAAADRQQRSGTTATAVLATLTVKGRAAKTGYARTQFGSAWTDDNRAPSGHNGCDTRNDILRRDLTAVTLKPGSTGCTVLVGTLHDPYTAATIHFQRGQSTSTAVQIDHVVALSNAWQTGAQYWTAQTRIDLANDPINLLAVNGPTNEAKGDGDAATWLPPNKAYRCPYVARQVAVKARYRLWITPAERAAIAGILSSCPGQTVPSETAAAIIVRSTPSSVSTQTVRTTSAAPSNVYYANCTAVRAAGAAPLHRGQPGYRAGLDRDDDGTACES